MHLLRLTQAASDNERHSVEIAFESDAPRRVAKADFKFRLTRQDEEDFRWYLEDYLQWPHEPAPTIAARVAGRKEELGTELFESIFRFNDTTRGLWNSVSEKLPDTRIEIVARVEEATSIPWELLREPGSEAPFALVAHSFVRAHPEARRTPLMPAEEAGLVRILVAICRPDRGEDVPFRSVATRILKGLDETSRQAFDLEVLRPPTFDALAQKLREASAAKRPYHVLHFDGHGAHLEMAKLFARWQEAGDAEAERILRGALEPHPTRFSPHEVYPRAPRPGKHGYLLFESSESQLNRRFVDGQELAGLLVETHVPVLVLNACRPAYAEARGEPDAANEPASPEIGDPHQAVRTWGLLAQELMDSGVGGVVAMRYSVYVVTAAEFARWYKLTGGVAGPVLFTSFEHHMPLARVLDRVGEAFGPLLERSGVQWLALKDDHIRRQEAFRVLRLVPLLWIWDNVEPITGFPAGRVSAWTLAEQDEILGFLRFRGSSGGSSSASTVRGGRRQKGRSSRRWESSGTTTISSGKKGVTT